jgi:hypothetical protein
MKSIIRSAGVASIMLVALMATATQTWAQAQEVRLRARQNKAINGIEAELRGDYREKGSPIRLNSELENINLPVGTKVAFCLLQNGVKSLIGVGQVRLIAGIPMASVELEANDGDSVPTVSVGDVLQARQKKVAPFKANPTCGSALLVSGAFQK